MSATFEVHGGVPLRGRLRVPGDKSISHRALILGGLADGTSYVTGLSTGEDVRHTAEAMGAMGAVMESGDRIAGGRDRLHAAPHTLDVGNSGTGIRLLAGTCAPFPWRTVLRGDASIDARPMDRVIAPLRQMGATIDDRYPPLTIDGGHLHGIDYSPPVASAQVKSAVLLAGLGAEGETVVREHQETRRHTEELLALAGVDVTVDGLTVNLKPPSTLVPFELDVPGDPSQAAFWIVAACIVPGSDLTVEHVYIGPARNGFLHVLQRMGARIEIDEAAGDIRAQFSPDLHATEVGGDEIPGLIDEIPVLAVAAAAADGTTVFRDAAELKVKESDRVATTVAMLAAVGGRGEPTPDGLVVNGGRLHPGRVDSHGDHRIAMAGAVAGLAADGPTRIEGWDAVATSYPGFEEDLRQCVS